MFNFFDEIKNKCKNVQEKIAPYQCVLIGSYLLYVEGFSALMTYTEKTIVFKVKGGIITVCGDNLSLKELSLNTITIQGKIVHLECL